MKIEKVSHLVLVNDEAMQQKMSTEFLHEGSEDFDGSCVLSGHCDLCIEAGNRSVELHARMYKYRV